MEGTEQSGLKVINSYSLTVKIKKAEFIPDDKIVRWETLLPDESPYTFSWPIAKYGYAIGVTKDGVVIPDKMLLEHLEWMTRLQKQFTWQINNVALSEDDHDQINKAMDQLLNGRKMSVEEAMADLQPERQE